MAENIVVSSRFRDLVQRFAKVRQISVEMAESTMKSRMLATVHRGDMPDEEQMLASLESLVHALETEQDRCRHLRSALKQHPVGALKKNGPLPQRVALTAVPELAASLYTGGVIPTGLPAPN
ncbi:hypothetical protein [Arthrobacter sp. ISL-30]|uniref:hypothetical protein n=1 Tax=Arthrobacter sp. ISL-30 TaxID=2819109 RepID=UPI002035BFAF|nr:hypothetical protein [Arthrobacter sp. ISL-30]